MDSCWAHVREATASCVSEGNFKIWIDPLQPLRLDSETLVLGCPNRFFLAWIRDHYLDMLNESLKTAGQNGTTVSRIELELAPPRKKEDQPREVVHRQEELPEIEVHARAPLRFNRRYTFDRFVVGDTNQYAYSAAKAIAIGSELNADSLFLLSAPGLGKSHLSQAVGQHVLGSNRRQRVYYLTAEDFTNELIYSIKNRCVENFKNKYRRNCDILVLEEIHFLAGKEKIQAELCYTLDCLGENGKRVVFTSAQLPKDIPRLGRPLASRLSNSVISTIQPPDFQTRVRIIEKKAAEDGVDLPLEVIELMADRLKRDVRQIESGLRGLGAKSRLLGRPIDRTMVEETLGDLVNDDSTIRIDDIQKTICRYYQLTPDELRSRSRKKEIVLPRNVGMYLSRKLTSCSLETIGKAYDRNHSTVLYSINMIENKSRRDPKLKGQVDFLAQQMGVAPEAD